MQSLTALALAHTALVALRALTIFAWGIIDILMFWHHDEVMRTTLDLPDDLHRIASSLARHNGRSLGQTVADLMRRGLNVQASCAEAPQAAFRMDEETGLPVILGAGRPMTEDDVRALESEA